MARSVALKLLLAAAAAAALLPPAAAWHQCSSQGVYSGVYGYQAIGNLSEFRNGLISSIWPFTTDPAKEGTLWQRYDVFNPFLSCPPNQPLRRVGSSADGGKIVCDVSRLAPPCVIYSLGSQGDYSFEREMLNLTQCEVHTFDCTYNGRSQGPRHTYHKTCLGMPSNWPLFKEYETITRELGHPVVDFLKIDIEGHEPSVLQSLVANKGPLPRQLAIEMHMRNAVGAIAPVTTVQMSVLFYHLAILGYGIVSREDNLWGVKGCCAEFTFLHVEQQHRHQRLMPAAGGGGGGGSFLSRLPIPGLAGGGGVTKMTSPPDKPMAVTVNGMAVVGSGQPVPGVLPPSGPAPAAAPAPAPAVTQVAGVTVLPAVAPAPAPAFGRRRQLKQQAAAAAEELRGGVASSGGRQLLEGASRRWGAEAPARWVAVGTWSEPQP